jgi:abequosyltransferase
MTRLSICIATYNRAGIIGDTIESIVRQLRPGVEVVIVDGASPDHTADVVFAYAAHFPAVRYIREELNSGVDVDYDKAVGYATGEYCWLATDDDLLAPTAIDRVLDILADDAVDLLVVDAEIKDVSLTRTLRSNRLGFTGLRSYGVEDADAFLKDAGRTLSFIGGTIVRREMWMARKREPYFGSLFVHVGVIFQSPAIRRIKLLGESLVILRAANGMWRPRGFEIWSFMWPALIWSFEGYSSCAKQSVTVREPWKALHHLLFYRAMGQYTIVEYGKYFGGLKVGLYRVVLFISAVFPGQVANILGVLALILTDREGEENIYNLVAGSRYSNPISRLLARFRSSIAGRSTT